MGKGTFYDYFANKEKLLNEIIRLLFADWTELVISKIGNTDEFIPKFRFYLNNGKNSVIDIIKDAQNKGLIKKELDSAAIAAAWIALIDGMCLHHMILKPEFDVDKICQSFFDGLLNGIKPACP